MKRVALVLALITALSLTTAALLTPNEVSSQPRPLEATTAPFGTSATDQQSFAWFLRSELNGDKYPVVCSAVLVSGTVTVYCGKGTFPK
jgi:hypothetical protein